MAQVQWKVIKPKAFNAKAFRDNFNRAMKKTADDMEKDFKRTVKTWEHKVNFKKEMEASAHSISVHVSTDDPIYRYVNEGTKPHDIWAGAYTGKSGKKALAFPGTFSAKTAPGVLDAKGGSSGGGTVHTPFVSHPGTEARKFDEVIERKWRPLFADRMGEAMSKAAVESYHGIRR